MTVPRYTDPAAGARQASLNMHCSGPQRWAGYLRGACVYLHVYCLLVGVTNWQASAEGTCLAVQVRDSQGAQGGSSPMG